MEERWVDEKQPKRRVARRRELRDLRSRAYEEKLLAKIDEKFWTERCAAGQRELEEIDQELAELERVPSDVLAQGS